MNSGRPETYQLDLAKKKNYESSNSMWWPWYPIK
jgi:hypothetical protein